MSEWKPVQQFGPNLYVYRSQFEGFNYFVVKGALQGTEANLDLEGDGNGFGAFITFLQSSKEVNTAFGQITAGNYPAGFYQLLLDCGNNPERGVAVTGGFGTYALWQFGFDYNLYSATIRDTFGNLILSETSLGPNIANSSLTSVGTLTDLTVAGDVTISGNLTLNDVLKQITTPTIYATTYLNLPPFDFSNLLPITLDKVNNRVGINKTVPTSPLDVVGSINTTNVYQIAGVDFLATRNTGSISVGDSIAQTSQGFYCVSLGQEAGKTSQANNSIAIGYLAGQSNQANYGVAIGSQAGQLTQGSTALAIGTEAGKTTQANYGIAIGYYAGRTTQGASSVAIGQNTGLTSQGSNCVAIGSNAGGNTQSINSIAVGTGSGQTTQGANCVAVGNSAGRTSQGEGAVAIGSLAGNANQGARAVAIGSLAGNANQLSNAISIGNSAGQTTQGTNAVAVGLYAGRTNQGSNSIAIGQNSGNATQGSNSIAIGNIAGVTNQNNDSICIGVGSGNDTQGSTAIAIGAYAGQTRQKINTIAIGNAAGQIDQNTSAIAIGGGSGASSQGENSIAIGASAGGTTQGTNAVAIGINAGGTLQGNNSLAIGSNAGVLNQHANTIILNGTGTVCNSDGTNRFYVNPIRNEANTQFLQYNTTSKEITYSTTFPQPTETLTYSAGGTAAANTLTTIVSSSYSAGTYAFTGVLKLSVLSNTDYDGFVCIKDDVGAGTTYAIQSFQWKQGNANGDYYFTVSATIQISFTCNMSIQILSITHPITYTSVCGLRGVKLNF